MNRWEADLRTHRLRSSNRNALIGSKSISSFPLARSHFAGALRSRRFAAATPRRSECSRRCRRRRRTVGFPKPGSVEFPRAARGERVRRTPSWPIEPAPPFSWRFRGGSGRVGSGLLGGRAPAELGIPRTRSLSDGEGSWALKFES